VRTAVKEVIGSCVSMGVKIEGKDAREFMSEIDSGKWDSQLQ
jgi:large subunit ribosomal protein L11